MRPRAPFGFWVAGAFSGWFGVAMVVLLLAVEGETGPDAMPVRGLAALLAVLSAVVTEALWRARPWVWRASLTLALAYGAGTLLVIGADSGVGSAMQLLLPSAVVVVPLLLYIRGRAKTMWPRPSAPVAAPRAQGRP